MNKISHRHTTGMNQIVVSGQEIKQNTSSYWIRHGTLSSPLILDFKVHHSGSQFHFSLKSLVEDPRLVKALGSPKQLNSQPVTMYSLFFFITGLIEFSVKIPLDFISTHEYPTDVGANLTKRTMHTVLTKSRSEVR
jgi:hypothetical protein